VSVVEGYDANVRGIRNGLELAQTLAEFLSSDQALYMRLAAQGHQHVGAGLQALLQRANVEADITV